MTLNVNGTQIGANNGLRLPSDAEPEVIDEQHRSVTTTDALANDATPLSRLASDDGTFDRLSGDNALSLADRRSGTEDRSREARREDRRIESDRRWGREEGGSRGTSDYSNDWAGRAILSRYLTAGDDWYIADDPDWTGYMQSNPDLTSDLRDRALTTAEAMYDNGMQTRSIDQRYSASTGNGEGVVGYQYLNGSNSAVGDFHRQGEAQLIRNTDGTSTVVMNMRYTWNDIIDPNPKYATDTEKAQIAEAITLGHADPYNIHISWQETTIVELDTNGVATSISNAGP